MKTPTQMTDAELSTEMASLFDAGRYQSNRCRDIRDEINERAAARLNRSGCTVHARHQGTCSLGTKGCGAHHGR